MELKCCINKKSDHDLFEIVKFLRTISEENRLKILCLLKNGKKCVCEIWENLQVSQNLASHHLKVLKDFGLISSKQAGLKVYYSLNGARINNYSKLLNKFLSK